MIGTNDVNQAETDIPTRLGRLMDSMLDADPSLLLVVAQIVPQRKASPDIKNMQFKPSRGDSGPRKRRGPMLEST